jgi:hypothetical protein
VEIVEIKKKGHKLQNDEFAKIEDYYDRIMEYLGNNPSFKEQFPKAHVTLICDDLNLDKTHQRAYDLISNQGNLVKKTWDELLTDAETVNRDFLEISRYKTAG